MSGFKATATGRFKEAFGATTPACKTFDATNQCIGLHITGCAVYSASPVLTATGFVNGRWQNPHPLTDHQKIWYRWLRRRPLQLWQIWCKSVHGGFWANGWNITNFFYLYLFFMNSPRSDPSTDFHAGWLKRRGLAQGCAFLGFCWHCSPFWGWNPPKTPILGAWIGVFKPNGQNIESFMLSKLLHRFQPNFAQR